MLTATDTQLAASFSPLRCPRLVRSYCLASRHCCFTSLVAVAVRWPSYMLRRISMRRYSSSVSPATDATVVFLVASPFFYFCRRFAVLLLTLMRRHYRFSVFSIISLQFLRRGLQLLVTAVVLLNKRSVSNTFWLLPYFFEH